MDKVQKIREEVERLRKSFKVISVASPSKDTTLENIVKAALCRQILSFIDSLQEEPVSKDICNQCEAHNDKDKCDKLVFGHKCPIVTTSEDLEEAVNAYIGHPQEVDECSSVYGKRQAFKAGAQWERDKLVGWLKREADYIFQELKKGNKAYGLAEQYRAQIYKEVINKIKDF